MNNFSFVQAQDTQGALDALWSGGKNKFLGGGTNLVDLMREGIEQPDALVDVTRLALDQVEETAEGSLRIGATVRNSHLAANKLVRARYPVLSQAILMGASSQLRNMATTAGNLMQRTRCYYFYDSAANCNKRKPGSGCDAVNGFNRIHAILGSSPLCIATHPSDMCVALAALGAVVQVTGKQGTRGIPFEDFHRLPGDTPHVDTNLLPDELITSVDIPALPWARNSMYRKVRDRASYAFALVSVAAALQLKDGLIQQVRIAFGGVAHKPWRAFVAEQYLASKTATAGTFRQAAEMELQSATAFEHNRFKIELAKRTLVDVLADLAAKEAAQ